MFWDVVCDKPPSRVREDSGTNGNHWKESEAVSPKRQPDNISPLHSAGRHNPEGAPAGSMLLPHDTSCISVQDIAPSRRLIHISLGVWRASTVKVNEYKHEVVGSVNHLNTLTFRIMNADKYGRPLSNFPLPRGRKPVKFWEIIFSKHLIGLSIYEVKDYVHRRPLFPPGENGDTDAAKAACEGMRESELPESSGLLDIAYGDEYPERISRLLLQPSTGSNEGTRLPNLPGTRPTRIIIGRLRGSGTLPGDNSPPVLGIICSAGTFRIRMLEKTHDGRSLQEVSMSRCLLRDVDLLPHLLELRHDELKEYCRVLQFQMDGGKNVTEAGEIDAMKEARQRVDTLTYQKLHNL